MSAKFDFVIFLVHSQGLANIGIGVMGGIGLAVSAPVYCCYIGAEANGIVGGLAGLGIGVGIGIIGTSPIFCVF